MTIHILSDGPHREVGRRRALGERWCFVCRLRTSFALVTMVPVNPSYYGPYAMICCDDCGNRDSDLFPGHKRVVAAVEKTIETGRFVDPDL